MKRLLATFVAIACALLLGGCTGVPSSSGPQTVEALDTDPATDIPSSPPPLNADPRTLVQSFLDANATDADGHSQARAYLTSAAQTRWSDTTATVIADDFSVDTYHPSTHSVTVFGRRLGTLNAAGIYTPSLQGIGEGGSKVPFQFTITRVGGQNRIDQLPNGLLLTDQQFGSTFQQHVLYFYDAAEEYLVPDLRWSALGDRSQLATWLLAQLATGPRPALQNAVSTDTLPAQADARHLTVAVGTPTRVEIPGSSQLDPGVRDRLAAQIGATLSNTVSGAISITDGGTPVNIPQVNDDHFSASDFTAAKGPALPDPAVYYLDNGRVYTETGKPLSGPLGAGTFALTAIAVGRPRPNGPLLAAGVDGSGSSQRLLVGSQATGLRPTKLAGLLSRPAFAPGRSEVWIGDGSALYRVSLAGTQADVSRVAIPAVSGGGRIVSLRLSPDGSRIAMVVSGAAASSAQLYIGSIVRGAGQVRVDTTLEPISPEGVVVTDIAWNDPQRLFGIGYLASTQDARTFETGVDGSEWTNLGIGNLAAPPTSVTVATAANVWVGSLNGYVWKQSGSQWVSPGPTGQTAGRAPVYLS